MPKTVKVAQTGELSPGTGKVIEADGRKVALFNVEGTFHGALRRSQLGSCPAPRLSEFASSEIALPRAVSP